MVWLRGLLEFADGDAHEGCMIMPLPSTVVEAQRKVRGKNGPIQKHRYAGTLSNEWTVLSALWIRQEPHEKVADAHGCHFPPWPLGYTEYGLALVSRNGYLP